MEYSLKAILVGLFITASLTDHWSDNVNGRFVEIELKEVRKTYGDVFFECLFSIAEYRKVFISVKPTSPDFPVTTPAMAVKSLSKAQKDKLYGNIASRIQSLPKKEAAAKIERINHWCLTKKQYEVIGKFDGYSIDFFVDAINGTMMLQDLFKKMYQHPDQGPESFSTAQLDQVYYESINVASAWPFQKLKKYYTVLLEKVDFSD